MQINYGNTDCWWAGIKGMGVAMWALERQLRGQERIDGRYDLSAKTETKYTMHPNFDAHNYLSVT